MYLFTMCAVPIKARRGRQNLLELELEMVVSCHVGPGNPPEQEPVLLIVELSLLFTILLFCAVCVCLTA